MQIGEKFIQISFCVLMVLENKIHKYKKTPFHASSLGNGLNKFQFGIVYCTMT